MIAPHKRTHHFNRFKEKARRCSLPVREDRPFSVYKGGKELRINTDHSVIIAYDGNDIRVWNKSLQYAGKAISMDELVECYQILSDLWVAIEGDVE